MSSMTIYVIVEAIKNYGKSDEENAEEKEKIEKYSEALLEAIEKTEEENNSKILFIVDDCDDWKKYKDEIPNGIRKRMVALDNSYYETFFNWYSKVCEEEVSSETESLCSKEEEDEEEENNDEDEEKLQIILYTDGGDVQMCDIICKILNESKCKVDTYIPYYALSSGTLIAFSSDNIHMNDYSFLSPVDAQSSLNNSAQFYSSDAYLKLLENVKDARVHSNSYLSAVDNSKLHDETVDYLREIFTKKGMSEDECKNIINMFGSGKYSHSAIFSYNKLVDSGLDINLGIPDDINDLFSTYLKVVKNIKKIKASKEDNDNDDSDDN